jgi:hypothetical protein
MYQTGIKSMRLLLIIMILFSNVCYSQINNKIMMCVSNHPGPPGIHTRYFISSTGNDSNTGLSSDHLWQTLTKVNATLLPKIVSLSQTMVDVKGTEYSGNVTLQPFT